MASTNGYALVVGFVEAARIFGRAGSLNREQTYVTSSPLRWDWTLLTEALSVPYREVQSALTAFPVSHSIEVT